VSLAEDQHSVGELGSDGSYEPLGEAVRLRAARRNLHHRDVRVGQDSVERRHELTGSVSDAQMRNYVLHDIKINSAIVLDERSSDVAICASRG